MKNWKYAVSVFDLETSNPVGEHAPLLLRGSIYENLEAAKQLGYDAVEIHTRPDAPVDWERVKEKARETGIEIAQLVTGRLKTEGGVDLLSENPYFAKAAFDGMKQYIALASRLGTNLVIGWAKGTVPQGGNRKLYIRRLADALIALNAFAEEKQVELNLEVINHYETNLFNTAKETAEFLAAYPELTMCKIHLDSYHMMLEEENFEEAIRISKDRIGYFHIADSTRYYPGSGNLPLRKMLELLEEIGYDGYVSVECFPRGDGYLTAQKAIAHLKALETSCGSEQKNKVLQLT